jgi:glutathione S-transferase
MVRVAILEWGLASGIECVCVHPFDDDPRLLRANPLGKVPVLLTSEGPLVDSMVITDFLWHRAGRDAGVLCDWQSRRRRAWVQGMLDTAVAWRQDAMRPEHQQSEFWQGRFRRAMGRTLDAVEAEWGEQPWPDLPAMETIGLACLLGYLDFRHGYFEWREGHPMLKSWYDRVCQRPSMTHTCPSD